MVEYKCAGSLEIAQSMIIQDLSESCEEVEESDPPLKLGECPCGCGGTHSDRDFEVYGIFNGHD